MNNTIYVSNVTTTDSGVILIPNRTIKTIINATCYRIVIACNVEATANLPVFIQTELGNIPVLCKFANTLYANQLEKRRMYIIGYGNENTNYTLGQFVIQSNVCPKGAVAAPGTKKKGE